MTSIHDADPEIPAFARLLRRYAFAYTANHDFTVCDSIMVDDYVLRMGEHELRGRDDAYKPATERQYRQYPGLGFTVHDFISNGERAALRFSEHGRSTIAGTSTSWRGISLYRWDHTRLTECRVEQDYCSRSLQVQRNRPAPVPPPSLDPWFEACESENPETVAFARGWLKAGTWLSDEQLEFDDEASAPRARPLLSAPTTEVLDIFGAGAAIAFHVRVEGTYRGGLPMSDEPLVGHPSTLYASGIVRVVDEVPTGFVVTDRLSMLRRGTKPSV